MEMGFASAVKNDAFAPVLIYIVPGAVALGPYLIVTASYLDRVGQFGKDHPTAMTIIATLLVILVGALLEELATRLELRWDRSTPVPKNWTTYLQLRLQDEIIGQRYLRRLLVRMKFELSMVFAFPILGLGLAWINHLHGLWGWCAFGWIAAVLLLLTGWMTWESHQSAHLLHTTRQLIIDAAQAPESAPRLANV
jgi:hypothetical protein